MVKKIAPFPHSELWGCEPGRGRASLLGESPPAPTEERIQEEEPDDIIQEPGPATTDEIYPSFTDWASAQVPGVLGPKGPVMNQSHHIPALRAFNSLLWWLLFGPPVVSDSATPITP